MALSIDQENRRHIGLTAMRVIACMAIVLLHTANVAEILYRDSISETQRMVSLTIVYCMMWAVPVFLMVSGALLLDSSRSLTLRKVFSTYVFRAGMALTGCVFLFRFFDMAMTVETFHAGIFADALLKLFTGTSWAHLWYLYLLIGLYLLLPFYRIVAEHVNTVQMRYLLIVYAVFLSLLPLSKMGGVTTAFQIQTASIYPFYFFAGYAIARGDLMVPRRYALAGFILSTGAIIGLSYLRFLNDLSMLDSMLGAYSSPLVAIQGLSFFTVFYTRRDAKPDASWKTLIAFLDRNGFGVYLIHMLYIRLAFRHLQINPYVYGCGMLVLYAFAFFVLAVGTVWILRRIPAIRRIL